MNYNKRITYTGFTLVELLIVVAIIGILYSVALPSYQSYLERSRRADVQQQILQYSATLERVYSRNGGYPNSFAAAANTEFYTFSYTPTNKVTGATADFKNRGYLLKATPKAGSAQAEDKCGVLSIKHDGSVEAKVEGCWE